MKLSLVILNYNRADLVGRLLNCLAQQTDSDFSTIVVDNNSVDAHVVKEAADRHHAQFIQSGTNRGFAGGNNLGLGQAFNEGSDWVLILNPDTEVEKDFIAHLKKGLTGRGGLVGIPVTEDHRIAYGGLVQWLKTPGTMHHVYHHTNAMDNVYVIGAALVISKEAYRKLGNLDDNYFLYFEDTDYSVRAHRHRVAVSYLEQPIINHAVSQSTKSLGTLLLLRYHYRNALYFNRKNGPWHIQILLWPWSWLILAHQYAKIILGKDLKESRAIMAGIRDFYAGRMGRVSPNQKGIGIECESIEGKNPQWGIGRIIMKLLEEISRRPELKEEFTFVLHFKDQIPDFPFLDAPIFEKNTTPVPGFPSRLFPFYYYAFLPLRLWIEGLDGMFWPNYMLPIIAPPNNLVILTEDAYYETYHGQLPFRYRLAYWVFANWTAKFARKILAISESSKREVARLYKIDSRRINVDHLGVDPLKPAEQSGDYVLFSAQAFPRRHLKETLKAFERIAPKFPTLRLIANGPDKYPGPTITSLIHTINKNLGREAVVHHDYVSQETLESLYRHAKALVYVSDREAFGLPPMEALSAGVPPIIADNPLGHELFKEYAFYAPANTTDGIAQALEEALTNDQKRAMIKAHGPEHAQQYSWSRFTDHWLDIVRSIL